MFPQHPPLSVAELIQAISDGMEPDFLFFWGHRPSKDGALTKSCFSQWWPAPFKIDGVTYATAEHYMMAGKARLCGDEAALEKILKTSDPQEAKRLGRRVSNYSQELWTAHRFSLVVDGNLAKFSQSSKLGAFLKATGNQVLVETSPVDAIWGIGMAGDDPQATNPSQWKGLNLLGFALMEVRRRLL